MTPDGHNADYNDPYRLSDDPRLNADVSDSVRATEPHLLRLILSTYWPHYIPDSLTCQRQRVKRCEQAITRDVAAASHVSHLSAAPRGAIKGGPHVNGNHKLRVSK